MTPACRCLDGAPDPPPIVRAGPQPYQIVLSAPAHEALKTTVAVSSDGLESACWLYGPREPDRTRIEISAGVDAGPGAIRKRDMMTLDLARAQSFDRGDAHALIGRMHTHIPGGDEGLREPSLPDLRSMQIMFLLARTHPRLFVEIIATPSVTGEGEPALADWAWPQFDAYVIHREVIHREGTASRSIVVESAEIWEVSSTPFGDRRPAEGSSRLSAGAVVLVSRAMPPQRKAG